jgi:hypothetical protein
MFWETMFKPIERLEKHIILHIDISIKLFLRKDGILMGKVFLLGLIQKEF